MDTFFVVLLFLLGSSILRALVCLGGGAEDRKVTRGQEAFELLVKFALFFWASHLVGAL